MLRLATLLCLAAAVQASFLAASTPRLGRCVAASKGTVPRCPAPLLKKGRRQGGGPAISTKKNKMRKTEAERALEKNMAEIARRAATAKKRPAIGLGRQRDRYGEQCSAGAARHPVYARPTGDRDWLLVGHVSVTGDDMSGEEAARLQKRLILEYATQLHKPLQQQSAILECGIGAAIGSEGDEAEAGSASPASVQVLAPSEDMSTLQTAVALARAVNCGFLGLPLPDAGHYFADNSRDQLMTDASKVTLSKLGNDAKSAIAVQQSKTLGLRSLG